MKEIVNRKMWKLQSIKKKNAQGIIKSNFEQLLYKIVE